MIVRATPFSSMARLTEELLFDRVADAEDLRLKSRICRIGEDLPARVDLELAPESREMVSRLVDF